MTTLTIKINKRSKAGKAFMTMSNTFFRNVKGVEIIENSDSSEKEKSPYNPSFVKEILKREANYKSGKSKSITLNPDDVWGSLGL